MDTQPQRLGHRPGHGMAELFHLHQAALRTVKRSSAWALCWCGGCDPTEGGARNGACDALQEACARAQQAYRATDEYDRRAHDKLVSFGYSPTKGPPGELMAPDGRVISAAGLGAELVAAEAAGYPERRAEIVERNLRTLCWGARAAAMGADPATRGRGDPTHEELVAMFGAKLDRARNMTAGHMHEIARQHHRGWGGVHPDTPLRDLTIRRVNGDRIYSLTAIVVDGQTIQALVDGFLLMPTYVLALSFEPVVASKETT